MQSLDDLFTWMTLGLILLAVIGLYAWLFRAKTKALFAALIRLCDRIDRSQRW